MELTLVVSDKSLPDIPMLDTDLCGLGLLYAIGSVPFNHTL